MKHFFKPDYEKMKVLASYESPPLSEIIKVIINEVKISTLNKFLELLVKFLAVKVPLKNQLKLVKIPSHKLE